MNRVFRFKKFSVSQDKAAMKVGTDGVLLGAWANFEKPTRILDIGAGTGLIALMMAQRFAAANIVAIDIEQDAVAQAKDNVKLCVWSERINVVNASIQNYKAELKFDLIVSNPPFFDSVVLGDTTKRELARFAENLPIETLIQRTSQLLSNIGLASFIVPYDIEQKMIDEANTYNLYPSRVTRVRGTATGAIKRSLVELSFSKNQTLIQELVIERARHDYTQEYISLVKDFYLKM